MGWKKKKTTTTTTTLGTQKEASAREQKLRDGEVGRHTPERPKAAELLKMTPKRRFETRLGPQRASSARKKRGVLFQMRARKFTLAVAAGDITCILRIQHTHRLRFVYDLVSHIAHYGTRRRGESAKPCARYTSPTATAICTRSTALEYSGVFSDPKRRSVIFLCKRSCGLLRFGADRSTITYQVPLVPNTWYQVPGTYTVLYSTVWFGSLQLCACTDRFGLEPPPLYPSYGSNKSHIRRNAVIRSVQKP